MNPERPLWLRRAVATLAVLALLALVAMPAARLYATLRLHRAVAAFGAPDVDLAKLELTTIPDHDNAATWIAAGTASLILSPEQRDTVLAASRTGPADRWPAALTASVRQLLADQRGALATLHRAAPLPSSSYGIPYHLGLQAEIPDLAAVILATRTLLMEARLAAADDDPQGAILALATVSRIATSLQTERTLVTALTGIACERLLMVPVAELAGSDRQWAHRPGFLAELEAAVPTVDAIAQLSDTLDAWVVMLAATPLRSAAGVRPFDLAELYRRPFPEVTRTEALRVRHAFAQLRGTPFGEAPERFMPPPDSGSDTTAIREGELGFLTALARAQAVAAQRQLVHAAIALRRLAWSEGGYPARRPHNPPLDTPDPFTGRQLIYEPHADRTALVALDGDAELIARGRLYTRPQAVEPIVLPAPTRPSFPELHGDHHWSE